eukprot:jgi/Tetstr1/426727/TSEL_001664.t1
MTELVRSWDDARTEALYAGHARQRRTGADLFAALLVGTADTVVALVEDGEFSRAAGRLSSKGMGDLSDSSILAQLRDKHPSRSHPIFDAAYDIPVDEAAMTVDMRVPYQQLKQHVAAGPSGMRNEYLRCLVGEYAPASGHAAVRAMSEVASMYLQGRLPGWFNRLFASARLVAHVKKLGEGRAPDVRFVAVGEAERRAAERAVVDNMKEAYVSVLAPSQLGVGISAGDSMLIHGVRLIAEKLGPRAVIVHTDLRNAYNEAWRRTIIQRHIDCSPLHPVIPALMSSLYTNLYLVVDDRSAPMRSEDGVQQGAPTSTGHDFLLCRDSPRGEVRFDKMHAYSADMEAARRKAPADIERPELDGHHGIAVLNLGSVLGRGSFNATSSARRYDHFLNDAHGSDSYAAEMREAWGRLQAAIAGHLGDADAERISFNQLAAASGMWTVVIPTARTVMTPHELREVAAGYFFLPSPCLAPVVGSQIILPSTEHNPVTGDLYGDALMNLLAHGDAHWRVQHDAIADAFRDHCVHDLGIVVRREVDDLFQQAVPLGNTVPRDELKDLEPDAELSLPEFNVVTGSYDPRSFKSTLLEFKTMRYGVKYTAIMPRATAADRFERSLLGDIQRGLAARDAAWHNTEPGQKGPLRDILDMSEHTGMVFGTVGLYNVASTTIVPCGSLEFTLRLQRVYLH